LPRGSRSSNPVRPTQQRSRRNSLIAKRLDARSAPRRGENRHRAIRINPTLSDVSTKVHTGDIGNTFGLNGFSIGSSLQVSRSKYPRSYCMKLTSHILSVTCLTLTRCLANTVLTFILRRL